MNVKKIVKNLWWGLTAFSVINNLPDAVIFVGEDGRITRFNRKAKEIFGLSDDEEAPIVYFDTIVKDGMNGASQSAQNSKPVLTSATVAARDFYVELNAVKHRRGYCINLRDMSKLTDEIVNEDKILRFNNEKNAMLAKLEGDIKSPLTSISGFSKGLLDGLGGTLSEKQAKYVKIINSNSEELYNFLDKLLEFSYAESSIYESEFHNFDIIDSLKSVISDVEAVLSAKKLAFDFDYEDIEKRTIYGDMNSIKRAFQNILETSISMTETGAVAVKVTNPDETVCLQYGLDVNRAKSYLQIVVCDSGTGIPEEEMKYLCEPYAQLEKGKKNFLRALKLGSASILVKRADGFINITSEVMKGSRFEIILPVEKD
ncbi:MAG: ATP-binding protein [Muribaculaceae bacterium]|nr:ATP-binding protein [Muribaculaceae bacterium]